MRNFLFSLYFKLAKDENNPLVDDTTPSRYCVGGPDVSDNEMGPHCEMGQTRILSEIGGLARNSQIAFGFKLYSI